MKYLRKKQIKYVQDLHGKNYKFIGRESNSTKGMECCTFRDRDV